MNGNDPVIGTTTTLSPAAMWLIPVVGGTGAGPGNVRSVVCWAPKVSRIAGSGPDGSTWSPSTTASISSTTMSS